MIVLRWLLIHITHVFMYTVRITVVCINTQLINLVQYFHQF